MTCGFEVPAAWPLEHARIDNPAAANTPKWSGTAQRNTVSRSLLGAPVGHHVGLICQHYDPAGCGKTCLVKELAQRTGNSSSMLHVHVDDQMDSKSLLGAYICTSVPGQFSWQPGPLAKVIFAILHSHRCMCHAGHELHFPNEQHVEESAGERCS